MCFFVHGYNNGFKDAAARYQQVSDRLFSGPSGLGVCISMDWPSLGSILGYLPDRNHARACAGDVAGVFDALHEWLVVKQRQTAKDPTAACKAKISIIAHSMGNYVTQKALAAVWKRNNQPLSVSLINQLVMVAADVDNDMFDASGASAGLKHFGTRRLGRSGLANRPPIEVDQTRRDNVWDIDCSSFFPGSVGGLAMHGAYFTTDETMTLIGAILTGTDRTVLESSGVTAGKAWP